MKEKLFLVINATNYSIKQRREKIIYIFYLMLARKKGKIMTSKDQENFWPKRRLQRDTKNNTQAN
jgi:hypothetical protein